MQIQNIVFDMGRVLIAYDPEVFLEKYADPADHDLLYREVFASVEWIAADAGCPVSDCVRRVQSHLPDRLHGTVEKLFYHWHNGVQPIPGMSALCHDLKEAGYSLYLLSNTAKTYYRYRDQIPQIQSFSGEFVSCDWKLLKPDPQIYRSFCAHFRLNPATCFFIDDSPANIYSARTIGMQGAVFHQDVSLLRQALRQQGILSPQ